MNKKITHLLKMFAFCSFSLFQFNSNAQAGSLDLTFDTDGKVSTPIGIDVDYGRSVALQSDGKIVVAGYSAITAGAYYKFTVARYNSNGSLDNTFDTDGKLSTAFGTMNDEAYSVAIQTDGKIVVAGASVNGAGNYDFALARYNSDGSLDNTFDSDGKVTTAIGTTNDYAYSLVIQPDGKIVVAGVSLNGGNDDFAVARYNTNGSLDVTFDADGKLTTPIGVGADVGQAVAIQIDGKILVAGYSRIGTNNDFALVRYNTNGSLDNSFDTDGKVTTAIGVSSDEAFSLAIQQDGKIVVAGSSYIGTFNDFAVARYNTNGSLDNTFDVDGMVTSAIGASYDNAYSVVLQLDGKILVAGQASADFAVARYNTNGSLDNTFDLDGKVLTPINASDDAGFAAVMQPDGKIIVAGFTQNGSNDDFAVVRYNNCVATTYTQSPIICTGQSVIVGTNTYTASGTYTNTLISVSSCDSIIITNLTVNPAPTITVNSGAICAGQSFTINPTGASTYTYSSGSNIVTTNTTVSVIGTNSLGCVSSNTAVSSVTVHALPIVSATTSNTLLCTGNTASITAIGAVTYIWNTSDVTSTIAVSPTITTNYSVTGTDANGCTNDAVITQSVSTCTGIYQNSKTNNSILIYPNPTSSDFFIDVNENTEVVITDVLGKDIYKHNLDAGINRISLSNYNSSVYFIKLKTESRTQIIKLIKQ